MREIISKITSTALAFVLLCGLTAVPLAYAQDEEEVARQATEAEPVEVPASEPSTEETPVVSEPETSPLSTSVDGIPPTDHPTSLPSAPLVESTPEAQLTPLAGTTLTIDTDTQTLDYSNLEEILTSLYPNPDDISNATTLKFTGEGVIRLGTSNPMSTSVGYLNTLNITALDLSAFEGSLDSATFAYANKIETVALGSNIEVLPVSIFYLCTALTTLSDTLENAALNPQIIDLDKTGVEAFNKNGWQFLGCSSITTVALGGKITSLASYAFSSCTALATLSDTAQNAKVNTGVIDLEKTELTSLGDGASQFADCPQFTTVTLGNAITELPISVFSGCTSLATLSDTLENAEDNTGVIDLASTGISSLATGGGQFSDCTDITTVTFGNNVTSLPQYIFAWCRALVTVSDTLEHAKSESAGVIDLASTNIGSLGGEGGQFRSCGGLTTVTLGSTIDTLPSKVFEGCSSLVTLSNSLENAEDNAGVIDLARTGISSLAAEGDQFYGCTSLTTVALGNATQAQAIETLPQSVFSRCSMLASLSDTLENAQLNSGVIDLEKTAVSSLAMWGAQFSNCPGFTTVTLGDEITSLPPSVFSGCTSLVTLSDTLATAQNESAGVIDLEKTGVNLLPSYGYQFMQCESITTVTLGSKIQTLPPSVFLFCYDLVTVTDTLDNAQGESAGLCDIGNLTTLELDAEGYQFRACNDLITYWGSTQQSLVAGAFTQTNSLFVPRTTLSLTVEPEAFIYSTASVKVYVKGPQGTSPTAITGADNIAPATLTYYYEVSATTDGNGTIARASTDGFLPQVIENREIAEGNLSSGSAYAAESADLLYTLTPSSSDYYVKKITATAGGVEADITTLCVDNGDGTWTFPGVTDDTAFKVSFSTLPVLTYSDANSTGNTYVDPTDYTTYNTVTVSAYDTTDLIDAGFEAPPGTIFSHWNTAQDDSGTSYTVGKQFNITEATSLYAIFGMFRVEGASAGYLGTASTLAEAVELCKAAGAGDTYTLSVLTDVPDMGTETVRIPAGYDISLTSDSTSTKTITMQGEGRHFELEGTLTLSNIVLNGLQRTSGSVNGGVEVSETGTLHIEQGAVIQQCYAALGGGVEVHGTCTMNGGEVSNNVAERGGGVAVQHQGTFTMNDGTISNNSAVSGGGIWTSDYSYANPADTTKYASIHIAATATVKDNKAQTSYAPPSNASSFTQFDGSLLTNDQINYEPTPGPTPPPGPTPKPTPTPTPTPGSTSGLARTFDSTPTLATAVLAIAALGGLALFAAHQLQSRRKSTGTR